MEAARHLARSSADLSRGLGRAEPRRTLPA